MSHNKLSVFRVDSGPNIGSGHIMRCLSLAKALEEMNWRCVFMIQSAGMDFVPALSSSGFEVHALHGEQGNEPEEMEKLLPSGCDLLVVDHYERDLAFENTCQPWASEILAIDDGPARHHSCDFLLDQTIDRSAEEYHSLLSKPCNFLLGSKFALLRKEFLTFKGVVKDCPPIASKILVTFGGSDPKNLTKKTIEALQKVEKISARVVVGSRNLFHKEIENLAKQHPNIEVLHDPHNMAKQMDWADMAISASGSTCWETLFMGLPTLLIVCAENQQTIAKRLDAKGIAISLGWFDQVSKGKISSGIKSLQFEQATRKKMSSRGQHLIDGNGAILAATILDRKFSEH